MLDSVFTAAMGRENPKPSANSFLLGILSLSRTSLEDAQNTSIVPATPATA